MHGHPAAAGDEADDRIARDGMAALAEAHQQVAHATHAHAARRRRRRRHLGQLHLVRVVDDAEPRDDLLGADLAVADGREEVVERLHAVVLDRGLEVAVVDLLERGPRQAPQLALQQLAPVGDVLVALLALEPLADLLARMAGGDDVEPVARRAVGAPASVTISTMSPFFSL